jgi:hypothetical protein
MSKRDYLKEAKDHYENALLQLRTAGPLVHLEAGHLAVLLAQGLTQERYVELFEESNAQQRTLLKMQGGLVNTIEEGHVTMGLTKPRVQVLDDVAPPKDQDPAAEAE